MSVLRAALLALALTGCTEAFLESNDITTGKPESSAVFPERYAVLRDTLPVSPKPPGAVAGAGFEMTALEAIERYPLATSVGMACRAGAAEYLLNSGAVDAGTLTRDFISGTQAALSLLPNRLLVRLMRGMEKIPDGEAAVLYSREHISLMTSLSLDEGIVKAITVRLERARAGTSSEVPKMTPDRWADPDVPVSEKKDFVQAHYRHLARAFGLPAHPVEFYQDINGYSDAEIDEKRRVVRLNTYNGAFEKILGNSDGSGRVIPLEEIMASLGEETIHLFSKDLATRLYERLVLEEQARNALGIGPDDTLLPAHREAVNKIVRQHIADDGLEMGGELRGQTELFRLNFANYMNPFAIIRSLSPKDREDGTRILLFNAGSLYERQPIEAAGKLSRSGLEMDGLSKFILSRVFERIKTPRTITPDERHAAIHCGDVAFDTDTDDPRHREISKILGRYTP